LVLKLPKIKNNNRRKNKMIMTLEMEVVDARKGICARYEPAKLIENHPDRFLLLPYWKECCGCENPYNRKCGGYVELRK
jgi:hypothetical protein